MQYSKVELLPSILKPSRPSQFDGESFTVLEYVSKVSGKLNECITQFNDFFEQVIEYCSEYTNKTDIDNEDFKVGLNNRFLDFIKVIELKYKSQDKVIDEAIDYMKNNLASTLEVVLKDLSDSGELNDTVLTAVGNLRAEFQTTVDTVTSHITESNAAYDEFTDGVTTSVNEMNSNVAIAIENANNASNEARLSAAKAEEAVIALDISIIDIDGKTPELVEDGTDYNGGVI